MRRMKGWIAITFLLVILISPIYLPAKDTCTGEECVDSQEDVYTEEDMEEEEYIADPLEPLNRISFTFNDRLYFWVLKPLAKGYSLIVPEDMRLSARNFFNNLAFPKRFFNCLLQMKFRSAGNEALRFMLNSTFGMLGMYDVAREEFGISAIDEDFGQTLGVWGIKSGPYIHWPFLGPSNIRDTLG